MKRLYQQVIMDHNKNPRNFQAIKQQLTLHKESIHYVVMSINYIWK